MYLNIFNNMGQAIKDFFLGLGVDVLSGLVGVSYWICMFVCIGGLLAYLAGFKQGGRYSTLSIMIYTTLRAILGAVR